MKSFMLISDISRHAKSCYDDTEQDIVCCSRFVHTCGVTSEFSTIKILQVVYLYTTGTVS